MLPEVDSREYAFAYLIRSAEDVPADFPIPEPERFRTGLFLPRDGPELVGTACVSPAHSAAGCRRNSCVDSPTV